MTTAKQPLNYQVNPFQIHSTATGRETLDTGWAWVVAVASFSTQVISSGLVYSTGILQMSLLDTYHQDVTKTAWIGSIFTATIALTGDQEIFSIAP